MISLQLRLNIFMNWISVHRKERLLDSKKINVSLIFLFSSRFQNLKVACCSGDQIFLLILYLAVAQINGDVD